MRGVLRLKHGMASIGLAAAFTSSLAFIPSAGRLILGSGCFHRAVFPGRVAVALATVATSLSSTSSATAKPTQSPPLPVRSMTNLPKPSVVFVLGGPGSGKGTQCEKLSKEYGYVHLSAGELLRKERESGSADGALIEEYLKEGRIVPVELSLGLLKKEMAISGATRFLIDGFPRSWDNLEGWERVMGGVANLGCVLFIECPETVLEERLLKRGLSSGRSDDNLESARKRFRTFIDTTMPIVQHYEKLGLVRCVNGAQDMDTVFKCACEALKPALEQEIVSATQSMLEAAAESEKSIYTSLCAPDATGMVGSQQGEAAGAETWGSASSGWRMSDTHVTLIGKDGGAVCYKRISRDGKEESAETRIWRLLEGSWRMTHLHRWPNCR